MRALALIFIYYAWSQSAVAQEPRETEAIKAFFRTEQFPPLDPNDSRLFEVNRYYKGLIVYKHPDSVAREMDIRFLGFADLSDPGRWLEGRGDVRIKKKDLYCFIFASHLFMRTDYHEYKVGDPRWGRVVINGPLRILEVFSKSLSSTSINETTVGTQMSKYGSYTHESPDAMTIGYCKAVTKLMPEAPEITARACAKAEGYKPKDFRKVVMEYNRFISSVNPELYAKSMAPYFHYVKFE
jgi:hypothetical protein